MTRMWAAMCALAVALVLTACAVDAEPPMPSESAGSGASMGAEDLAAEVQEQYPDLEDVTCSGDLELTVDATQDCTGLAEQKEMGVRVTATAVDGEEPTLGFTPFLSAERVAGTVAESLDAQGYTAAGGTCEGPLLGVEGETTTCEMTTDEFTTTITATVTTVDDLVVDFRFEN